jgi:hypothetical protein
MKTQLLIIPAFCFAFLQGVPQDANLFRENVTMKLDSAHFTVSGEYFFRNPLSQPVSQTIFYPHLFEKQGTKVDTISIYDESDNIFLKPKRKMTTGVFFLLDLNKNEEKKVRISYTQDHDGQSATYILASARYLPKPLTTATYSLKVSSKIAIDSCSLKPDNQETINDLNYLQWHKANFKPTRDLIIYFHLKK